MSTVKTTEKIRGVIQEFDQNFKERFESVRGSLLAMLAGEHVLLLGPPGTAKSLMARRACEVIQDAQFFQYLLTRFTTPEEIFGPMSIKALQEDIFQRKIDGYLPTAHIAFLDEIFKANSSILNCLLTIINERMYHNGKEIVKVPLLSIFGASNELPEENENLEALYDRFLFRYLIEPIHEEANFIDVVIKGAGEFRHSKNLSLQEILEIRESAKKIEIAEEVIEIIKVLRKDFIKNNFVVSDRRWKKIVNILKIGAAALDRKLVDTTLVLLIPHMIWEQPEQKNAIKENAEKLVVSRGINLDELEHRILDLSEFIGEKSSTQLDEPLECYNCNFSSNNINEIIDHAKREKHRFECPYCGTGASGTAFATHIETKHSIRLKENIKVIGKSELRLYIKEYTELKESYKKSIRDVDKERDILKGLLETNFWLIDTERIVSKYDEKIKKLKEIEEHLINIEQKLEESENALEVDNKADN